MDLCGGKVKIRIKHGIISKICLAMKQKIYRSGGFYKVRELKKIGVQFVVNSEGGPKECKGTAYVDNTVLIYEHP